MKWRKRLHLIRKILFGQMVVHGLEFYNPGYGTTEVTLRDDRIKWEPTHDDEDLPYCMITPRCAGVQGHYGECTRYLI
jgi:hypothetical protein